MENAKELIEFIDRSPTAYHAVAEIASRLISAGFTEISESDISAFSDGGRHFVIRADSSIIAFFGSGEGFSIATAHNDTPSFKIKGSESAGKYIRLDTEKYGGSILYSWLDRPLGVAGRVAYETESGISVRLVDLRRPVAVIPSVAIHQNRSVNDNLSLNPKNDMLPLVGMSGEGIFSAVAKELSIKEDAILSADLFVYNKERGSVVGLEDELVVSARLDDLGCAYAALSAFLSAENEGRSLAVLAVFDNEEVGSGTRQGADSPFLSSTLKKIAGSPEKYSKMLENTLMLSADNAHAAHPNHPELSDRSGSPALGSGVALKFNANQRYATDSVSAALVKKLAKASGAKLSTYYCRADMPCGTTLGPIAGAQIGALTADIGLPQLAMHSAMETAAVSDLSDMIALIREHFSCAIKKHGADYSIN